jgi:RNA polymerase-binding protein DksA
MSLDTERFRGALLQRKEHLEATIAHHDIGGSTLTEETGELSDATYDNHLADMASETYERELDEGLEEDAVRQLREVDEALGRIADGSYGTCTVCGREIGEERLEAVPWATMCIDDARKQGR